MQKYENQIIDKTKLEVEQLMTYSKFLFYYLKVFPNFVITIRSKQQAYNLCKDIDLKDITYLALSIELDIPLFSRDEPLYKRLRKKGYKNVILFSNFTELNR